MPTNETITAAQNAKRHQRALNIIKRWRLMDDDFMKRCFKDNIPAVECILRIIMEKPDLQVQTVQIEDTIPNLSGHGIRMDVHATDSTGTEYDIEVQRADKGAGTKRARFNSSLLDLNSLRKGSDYEQLPESYVIFITENDVWQHGLARYHVNRIIEELNRPFEDGSHIIYVNGNYKGNDDMGKLMNDFRSENVEDMVLEPLKETVHRYKNNPEEVAVMCAELEKWSLEERQEGRLEGLQAGRQEGESRLTTLLKMLKADGRLQDLELAIDDEKAREKLYREYHIN
ncbi:PD-(D/E)XK nuclease family transposase [uncultured Megasphaera sp.]|uniref:PD-(D/E)XK nuclease family transposase n=1 Tax=uncultured Megasphaera sp. TaxID=165188 RepID=UPI00266CBE90|nr:PD-(D/E)XK nuclease family transposase [uncultured Megasphaera sp.]